MKANPERTAAQERLATLKSRMGQSIRGKDAVLDRVVICLLAGGHLLLEDLPGMGKTTLAYALARATDGAFQRIQFTSDLLPADVLGVSVYNEQSRTFEFRKGPVFANFVLADEINRTTPKTQSALLEVMDRGQVSMDGETFPVGNPFMVFATQNPVDYEGTFPLPDSQMDRFFMRMEMGYPAFADELSILTAGLRWYDRIEATPVVNLEDIRQWQEEVESTFIEPSVLEYLLQLVVATRSESTLRSGISPRGALALKVGAQARAFYHGREFVLPEDIRDLFLPVCSHRLGSLARASDPLEERRRVEGVLRHILEKTSEPL
jgi:MoxR-like ATPase